MGVEPSKVEEAMNEEIEKMKHDLISDRELQKLKNQIESQFVSSNSTMAGIAEELANYHTYFGDANLINTEIDRYLSITPEDIRSAANKYYKSDARATLYFLFQDDNTKD